jgi:proteasome beta subunit
VKDPKKGTTTIGMVCKDGIILAADRRVTAGHLIAHKNVKKVLPISNFMAITTAGLVSDIQLFTKIIKAQVMLLKLRKRKEPSVKEGANMLASLAYSNIRTPSMIPGIVGFLFGGYDKDDGYGLYEISFDGTILDVGEFAADGSGSYVAIGVLETLYKPGLTCEQGKEIAIKALTSAMSRDSATGEGVDVLRINEKGVEYIAQRVMKSQLK